MVFFVVATIFEFVVTLSLPYMLDEPAWLGSKVGFIFGGIAVLGLFWGVFWMPEFSQKSLEDIDVIYEEGIPAWQTRRKSSLSVVLGK